MPIICFLIELRIFPDLFCVNVFFLKLTYKINTLVQEKGILKQKNEKKTFVDIITKLSTPPPNKPSNN